MTLSKISGAVKFFLKAPTIVRFSGDQDVWQGVWKSPSQEITVILVTCVHLLPMPEGRLSSFSGGLP